MLRTLIALTTCLAILVGATVATAQTAKPTQTTTTTQSTTQTSSSTQGAFSKLSPGNQKIAQALYDAQQTSTTTKKLSLDDIAAMKQHRGWGEIFKQMKEQGLVQEKNLGQVISHANQRAHSGSSSGTTITSASGRSQVVGKPEYGNKSGKGRMDDDGAGSSYGRGSDSGGPGQGYSYGHGDSSGSSGGMGRSGMSQGGGHGK